MESPAAPVVATLYGDLECPACRRFVLGRGFATLLARDVQAGRVRIIYRSFETASQDPKVFEEQQGAALAAGEQHRFWRFVMLFLAHQPGGGAGDATDSMFKKAVGMCCEAAGGNGAPCVTDSFLNTIASEIPGLNLDTWKRMRRDPALAAQVRADEQLASRRGIMATPTLVFSGQRGTNQLRDASPTSRQMARAIRSVG